MWPGRAPAFLVDVARQGPPELSGGELPGSISGERDRVVAVPPGPVVVDPADEGGERGPGLRRVLDSATAVAA